MAATPSGPSPTAPPRSCSIPEDSFLALFGSLQHVIGGLDLAEALLGVLVALLEVGVMFLGKSSVGGPHGLVIGVAVQAQNVQRPHFFAAARAVAGPTPFVMGAAAIGRGAGHLFGLARRLLLLVQAFEIIPVLVVLGGMAL